jgi:hypothetical protein
MSKPAFSIGLTLALGIYLSACNPSTDFFDYVVTSTPSYEADQRTAGVGEPVEVTLATTFKLFEQSRVPQRAVTEIELGACFGTSVAQSESLNNPHGYCAAIETDESLPAWLSLADSTSHVSAVPKVIVRRGQEVRVEHTFSFTRTEPGQVVILPALGFYAEGDGQHYVGGEYLTVTFE